MALLYAVFASFALVPLVARRLRVHFAYLSVWVFFVICVTLPCAAVNAAKLLTPLLTRSTSNVLSSSSLLSVSVVRTRVSPSAFVGPDDYVFLDTLINSTLTCGFRSLSRSIISNVRAQRLRDTRARRVARVACYWQHRCQ